MIKPELPHGGEFHLDLGSDHYLRWVGHSDRSGRRVGAIVYHKADSETGWCSCAVWWDKPYEPFDKVFWQIHGEPDEHLTLTPSVGCSLCPDHGYIRDGKWIRA